MNKIGACIVSICLCLISGIEAQAEQVPFTLTIDTIYTANNPYTVSAGSTYNWNIVYDQSKITSIGTELLVPGIDPTLQVDATIGTYHFNITDAAFYSPGYPVFIFTNGFFAGFFSLVVLDANGHYSNVMQLSNYQLLDADSTLLYDGHFTYPVPEPSTFILVAAGILGMILFKRVYRRTD